MNDIDKLDVFVAVPIGRGSSRTILKCVECDQAPHTVHTSMLGYRERCGSCGQIKPPYNQPVYEWISDPWIVGSIVVLAIVCAYRFFF